MGACALLGRIWRGVISTISSAKRAVSPVFTRFVKRESDLFGKSKRSLFRIQKGHFFARKKRVKPVFKGGLEGGT